MLNLVYFAWVRERMGKPSEQVEPPDTVATVADLATWLAQRDAPGSRAFAHPTAIRAAVNQDFASPDTPVRPGDEIAFFPPVTGG